MIAAWMFYCSLCALGLAAAAALAERTLLAGRGAVRFVWVAAVGLSLLVPIAAFQLAPRPVVAVSPPISVDVLGAHAVDLTGSPSASIADAQPASPSGFQWRATMSRLDAPLTIAWLVLSLTVAINLVAGMVALAWMRRRWGQRTVLGVPVFISQRTGPAVVGVAAPAIVVPEWAIALEPSQLSLLLRHEQEHQRAGDGRLLTLAQLALIAMPWNIALWWQILRLRGAVELDCDARVLRDADLRAYGNLLLEVARPRRGPSLLASTAFAERATQLERRIRVMGRHRTGTPRAARVIATCSGLLAVTLAWVAPHPPVPARTLVADAAPTITTTQADSLVRPPAQTEILGVATKSDSVGQFALSVPPRSSRVLGKPRTSARDSARVTRAGSGRATASNVDTQSGGTQGAQSRADTIFSRLFEGIALTPDAAARARSILARLYQEQARQDSIASLTALAKQAKAVTARLQRDSALRALLTNDADRATFDARAARQRGGPRSGGAGRDSMAVLPGGRGGAGGRGRGGGGDSLAGRGRFQLDTVAIRDFVARAEGRGSRGGGAGRGVATRGDSLVVFRLDASRLLLLDSMLTAITFNRLFEGITLTAEQESRARTLIAQAQRDMQGAGTAPMPLHLRMNPSGLVSISPAGLDSLLQLVPNEADRAKLQTRIRRPR